MISARFTMSVTVIFSKVFSRRSSINAARIIARDRTALRYKVTPEELAAMYTMTNPSTAELKNLKDLAERENRSLGEILDLLN